MKQTTILKIIIIMLTIFIFLNSCLNTYNDELEREAGKRCVNDYNFSGGALSTSSGFICFDLENWCDLSGNDYKPCNELS